MLEIVDGFGMASDAALKLRFDAKISCIKEEAETSSYNQAYDQFVAKSDKLHQEEATNILKMHLKLQKVSLISMAFSMLHFLQFRRH